MYTDKSKPVVDWEKIWRDTCEEIKETIEIQSNLTLTKKNNGDPKNDQLFESVRFRTETLIMERKLIIKMAAKSDLEKRIQDPEHHTSEKKKLDLILEKNPLKQSSDSSEHEDWIDPESLLNESSDEHKK